MMCAAIMHVHVQGIKLYWHVLEAMLRAEEARAGLSAAGEKTSPSCPGPCTLWLYLISTHTAAALHVLEFASLYAHCGFCLLLMKLSTLSAVLCYMLCRAVPQAPC